MAAQLSIKFGLKHQCDIALTTLQLRLEVLQKLLNPEEDGDINSSKVKTNLKHMEKDYDKFEQLHASYRVKTELSNEEAMEDDKIFKDCF